MVLILGKGAEGPWGQGTQGQLEGNVLPAVLCEAATVSTVFQSESARAGATPLLCYHPYRTWLESRFMPKWNKLFWVIPATPDSSGAGDRAGKSDLCGKPHEMV